MNWADWAIVAILGFSVVISIVRGFLREALSLLIWAGAFIAAMVFHTELANYLTELVATPSLRALVAWLVIFFGGLMLGSVISFLLGKMIASTGLTGTDRLLGVIFGGLRGFIVIMALLIIVPGVVPVTQDSWWHESILIPYFLSCEEWVMQTGTEVLNFFKSFF